MLFLILFFFFFSSRRRHTRLTCDWSSDVCSSDLSNGRAASGSRSSTTTIARRSGNVGIEDYALRLRLADRGARFLVLEDLLVECADAPRDRLSTAHIRQIGRASCREGGESSGEAG